MKTKIFIVCVISLFLCNGLIAQDVAQVDTSWKKGGIGSLSFNQVGFSNWAAGGDNALSGAAYLSLFANYTREKMSWDNMLDLAYGLSKIGDAKVRKNEDKIDLNSKLGYRAGEGKLFYTFLFNFKSQFANGDSIPVSKFASPAYVLYSLGIDYKPNDYFSLYFSPVTGKTLLVNDQRIADAGIYGNEGASMDLNGNLISGKKTFTQLGPYLRAAFKKDVFTNVNLQAKLELFSNYFKNPQNIAVNAELLFAMKINKYLSANLATQLIYDDIISVPVIKEMHGVKLTSLSKKVQIKEVFGLGLSYKF
jgi:hypothetical protein